MASTIGIPVHGTQVRTYGSVSLNSVDANGYPNDSLQLKYNTAATAAPGVGNDNTQGYAIGSEWWDTTNHHVYKCLNAATGAAVWVTLG
jgi:hypothetical protein